MKPKITTVFNQGLMIILLCTFFFFCEQKKNYEYPVQNPELSFEERAENSVSPLTSDVEAISQIGFRRQTVQKMIAMSGK